MHPRNILHFAPFLRPALSSIHQPQQHQQALKPLLLLQSSISISSCPASPLLLGHHPTCALSSIPVPKSSETTQAQNTKMPRGAVLSVTHGGGPLPLLGDPAQKELADSMRTKAPAALRLGTPDAPRAVVLVTAHWETPVVHVSSADRHDLLYDYHGFPAESYSIRHDAPGSKEVAGLVKDALKEAGIEVRMDAERGWDHGVFVPMKLMDPGARVPVVQVSVLRSQSPAALYALGRALAPLREQNVAIVGSGSASFHNFKLLFAAMGRAGGLDPASMAKYSKWNADLDGLVLREDPEERRRGLERWRDLESAYDAHPAGKAEHFSPLIVCAGAAGSGRAATWTDPFVGFPMRTYHWD